MGIQCPRMNVKTHSLRLSFDGYFRLWFIGFARKLFSKQRILAELYGSLKNQSSVKIDILV